jgi:DNA-binding NarL/FixJ family response regulator
MGVLKFLQRQFHRPRVVLWSNTMERVNVSTALRLGADLVCQKPARKEELMDIMHRIETKIFRCAPVVSPLTRTTTTSMPVEIPTNRLVTVRNRMI